MKDGHGTGGPVPHAKPILPIDIHYNKILDWLIDRRHCDVTWATEAVVIRGKINAALSLPETEIPDDDPLRVLLAIPHPNFFHVRQIVDILAKTEKEKKNFIGQCTSSILNAWSDILRTYQKNGCYLAESAQQLIRYVNYEITALKKAIDKNKKMVKECERKEAEYASQVSQTMEVYKSKCRRLGIEGQNVKKELLSQLTSLPVLYATLAEDCKGLQETLDYYKSFIGFLDAASSSQSTHDASSAMDVPILKHVLSKGNTTVFEFKTGVVPTVIQAPDVGQVEEEGAGSEELDIDWGVALEITETNELPASEAVDIQWETEEGGMEEETEEINWGIEGGDLGGHGFIDIEVVGDSVENGAEASVAKGKDALTILGNPEIRIMFLDELMELEAFLGQRLMELRRDHDVLAVNQFQNAPVILQNADEKKVDVMRGKVEAIIARLQSEKMIQLGLIRANPRSLDRLTEGVTQYVALSDRMKRNCEHVTLKRREAEEESSRVLPLIDALRKKTKELQKNIEGEISLKYENRPVNIMGEINLI